MKYILSCKNKKDLLFYEKNLTVDGFIVGIKDFSLDSDVNFSSLEELSNIVDYLVSKNKKVFIDLKILIHNHQLNYLKEILKHLDNLYIEAIMFTDPCVYMLNKELDLNLNLMYCADVLITHSKIPEILNDIANINMFSLSKEITKEDINEIHSKLKSNNFLLEYQVFGPLRMFYSKRKLINNYLSYINEENTNEEYNNYLWDKERNNYYFINQNTTGTHIFSPKNICLIDELDFFKKNIFFKYLTFSLKSISREYFIEVYNNFVEARNLCLNNHEKYECNKNKFYEKILIISDKYNYLIDKGFFYKLTIY